MVHTHTTKTNNLCKTALLHLLYHHPLESIMLKLMKKTKIFTKADEKRFLKMLSKSIENEHNIIG